MLPAVPVEKPGQDIWESAGGMRWNLASVSSPTEVFRPVFLSFTVTTPLAELGKAGP